MFSRRLWLVLTITTIMFQNVYCTTECEGQKFAKETSLDHFKKLMDIDTGYSEEEKSKILSEEAATENPENVIGAIQVIHRQLLCFYTFNMVHYLNLLGQLFSNNGMNELTDLITNNEHTVVLLKDDCVKALNVLYHFGMLKDMDPLWLVYMFVKYIESIGKDEILDRRENILIEHGFFSEKLSDMHKGQNCKIENQYNELHEASHYHDHLLAFQLDPLNNTIKDYIAVLRKPMEKNYIKIDQLLTINHRCKILFSNHFLRLEPIWRRKDFMIHWLVDFAEMTRWELPYDRILGVYKKKLFHSALERIKNIVDSHSLFINLIIFTMLNAVWKHVTLINLSLSPTDNEEQPHTLWQTWTDADEAIERIDDLNKSIAKYIKEIIVFFNLKEDSRLLFLTSMLELQPKSFINVQDNKTHKEWLSNKMDEIYSQVFGCKRKLVRSSGLVNLEYIAYRMEVLTNLSKNHDIDISCIEYDMKYNSSFESVLSNYLFYSFMKNVFFGKKYVFNMDFDVIRSFIDFSDKLLSISVLVSSD